MSKIKALYIKNFVGVQELDKDVDPDVNTVAGKNGSGKSSTLNAIADVFGASEVVTILREGEEEGENVVLLDDGTKVKKEFDAEGNEKVTITDPIRGKIPQADTKKRLKKFTSAFALRPMAFLTCDDKDRARIFLSSIKAEIPESSIATMQKSGIDTRTLPITDDKIGWLNAKRKEIETERRDINRNVKELVIHTGKLEDTLPKQSGADIKKELAAAEEVLSVLQDEFDTKDSGLSDDESNLSNAATDSRTARFLEIEEEYRAKMEEITKWRSDQKDIAQDQFEESTKKSSEIISAKRAELKAEYEPRLDEAKAAVTELKTKNEANIGYDKLREEITNERLRLAGLREKSEKCTEQMDFIDKVKLKILEKTIDGIDIRSDDKGNPVVYLDGHPWSDANTARRVEIGFQNALSMMGELRTVLIDDAEHLDQETTDEIIRQAKELDVQVFLAPVTNTPFSFN